MKKMLGVLLAITFFTFSYSIAQAEEQKQDAGQVAGVELMFVQNSKSVTFDKNTMTLKDVSPSTTFFSDRPERIAGHIPTTHFLKIWEEGQDSFKEDPPNANLSILGEKEGATNVVVELSNPRIKGKDFIYDVRILEGTPPKVGGISSLFIDWWAAYGRGPGYYRPGPRVYYGPGPGIYCHRNWYTYGTRCNFPGPYYRPPLY